MQPACESAAKSPKSRTAQGKTGDREERLPEPEPPVPGAHGEEEERAAGAQREEKLRRSVPAAGGGEQLPLRRERRAEPQREQQRERLPGECRLHPSAEEPRPEGAAGGGLVIAQLRDVPAQLEHAAVGVDLLDVQLLSADVERAERGGQQDAPLVEALHLLHAAHAQLFAPLQGEAVEARGRRALFFMRHRPTSLSASYAPRGSIHDSPHPQGRLSAARGYAAEFDQRP